jgi:hypothetical protein
VHQPDTHSFIVKVWREETIEKTNEVKWRGHITHVSSGERQYFQNLPGILTFIMPYLERMGDRFGILRRLGLWLLR